MIPQSSFTAVACEGKCFSPVFFLVFEIRDEDVDAVLKRLLSVPPSVKDGVVRLRGLPYSCTEVDIEEFFAGDF